MDLNQFCHLLINRGVLSPPQVQSAYGTYQQLVQTGVFQSFYLFLLEKRFLSPEQLASLGVRVGGFQLVSFLGKGNTAYVFQARRLTGGGDVALKIMTPPGPGQSRQTLRFKREINTALQLDHPLLVKAYEGGEDEGAIFFAMELVRGKTLGQLLEERGVLSIDELFPYLYQIVEVLGYLDKMKIVHRDIKPDNIMVLPNGEIRLCDVGLARNNDPEDHGLTKTGTIVGTPYYVSPELIKGQASLDIRSDFYSLGATVYHLLVGKPPFEGTTIPAVYNRHLLQQIPPYRELKDKLARSVYYTIKKMLAKEPGDRHQSAAELTEELEMIERGDHPSGVIVPSGEQLTYQSSSTSKVIPILGGVIFVLIIAIAYFAAVEPEEKGKDGGEKDDQVASSDGGRKKGSPPRKTKPIPRPWPLPSASKKVISPQTSIKNLWISFADRKFQGTTDRFKVRYIKKEGKLLYRKDYKCLTLRNGGMRLFFDFSLSSLDDLPEQVYLYFYYCSSSDKGKGNSPLNISVNDHSVREGYCPGTYRGIYWFVEDRFNIRPHLKKGKNRITLQFAKEATTQLFLRKVAVFFRPKAIPGFGFIGYQTYRVGEKRISVAEYRHLRTKMDFTLFPADLRDRHHPVLVGKYEVTQGQWIRIMGRGTEAEKRWKKDLKVREDSDFPAVYMTQLEAQTFAGKLDMSLLSGLLWKSVYHGGGNSGDDYFWPGKTLQNQYLWHRGNTGKAPYPHRVGLRKANLAGLYDVAGNVWEWGADRGVVLGGSYRSSDGKDFSIQSRQNLSPEERQRDIGFRLAFEVMGK